MAKLRFKTTRSETTVPTPDATWAPPTPADAVEPDRDPGAPTPDPVVATTDATTDATEAGEAVDAPEEGDESIAEPLAEHVPAAPLFARLRDGFATSWAGNRYGRRRFAVLCTLAVALGVIASRSYGPQGRETSEVASFADVDLPDRPVTPIPLAAVLNDAADFKARTGTFAGFAASGVLVAASTNTVVLAAVYDKVCTYTAIEDGVRRDVLVDPTGSACTRSAIDEVQAQLALDALAPTDEAVERLRELVPSVRRAALMYASLTYADGAPSLTGLQELPVPGATLRSVSPDGSYALFELRDGPACRVVRIYAQASRQPGALRPC